MEKGLLQFFTSHLYSKAGGGSVTLEAAVVAGAVDCCCGVAAVVVDACCLGALGWSSSIGSGGGLDVLAEATSSSLLSCLTGMVSGDTIEDDDDDFAAEDDLEAEGGADFTTGRGLIEKSSETSLALGPDETAGEG